MARIEYDTDPDTGMPIIVIVYEESDYPKKQEVGNDTSE